MTWYCVIIDDGTPRAARATTFLRCLRHAWRSAGAPADAIAFVNRGAASHVTFLLSPAAATLDADLLRRHHASACAQQPRLGRYAPLRL